MTRERFFHDLTLVANALSFLLLVLCARRPKLQNWAYPLNYLALWSCTIYFIVGNEATGVFMLLQLLIQNSLLFAVYFTRSLAKSKV